MSALDERFKLTTNYGSDDKYQIETPMILRILRHPFSILIIFTIIEIYFSFVNIGAALLLILLGALSFVVYAVKAEIDWTNFKKWKPPTRYASDTISDFYDDTILYCVKCKTPIQEGAEFCDDCGEVFI
ncbi:MAG: hypothetical protein INQ03_17515 [Candidatus Heimdallarchaeota archaeon]|nr:hypothetical protein [Candidatus Heimdallarchaeota archaeon]